MCCRGDHGTQQCNRRGQVSPSAIPACWFLIRERRLSAGQGEYGRRTEAVTCSTSTGISGPSCRSFRPSTTDATLRLCSINGRNSWELHHASARHRLIGAECIQRQDIGHILLFVGHEWVLFCPLRSRPEITRRGKGERPEKHVVEGDILLYGCLQAAWSRYWSAPVPPQFIRSEEDGETSTNESVKHWYSKCCHGKNSGLDGGPAITRRLWCGRSARYARRRCTLHARTSGQTMSDIQSFRSLWKYLQLVEWSDVEIHEGGII